MTGNKLNSYGRRKITCSLTEKELTADNIKFVLADILPIHIQNSQDIEKLEAVYRGDQDIYKKQKKYRPDINNKFVENHILHAVKFKVGYVFDGIQYVQILNDFKTDSDLTEDNKPTEDMNNFNKFLRNAKKEAVTNELAKQAYKTGVATLMTYLNPNDKNKPFELVTVKPTQAFVVYSNNFRGERLFSVELFTIKNYQENKIDLHMVVTTKAKRFTYKMPYEDYSGWTKGLEKFDYNLISYLPKEKPIEEINQRKDIPVFEYTLNDERLSLTEIGLDAQNALNKLTSSNIDDLEQYVQSLTVGVDVTISKDNWEGAGEQGLLLLKTGEEKKGDIKILSQTLDYTGLQATYEGIQNRVYTIWGVPLLNIGGGGGDTGQARLTDNGWLMAEIKAQEESNGFKKSEQFLLEYLIKVLKERKLINELEASDIDVKFDRNKTDNIQSKTQALQMLISSGIHPKKAIEVVSLFGDPAEVYQASLEFYSKDFYLAKLNKEENKNNNQDNSSEKYTKPNEEDKEGVETSEE